MLQTEDKIKRKVKVNIMNMDYTIVSEDEEMYIINVANDVDKKISIIASANPTFTNIMSTTLACLEYCDELVKEKKTSENLRNQIRDYLNEISNQADELEKLKADNKKLREAVVKLVNEKKGTKINTVTSEEQPEKKVEDEKKEEAKKEKTEQEEAKQDKEEKDKVEQKEVKQEQAEQEEKSKEKLDIQKNQPEKKAKKNKKNENIVETSNKKVESFNSEIINTIISDVEEVESGLNEDDYMDFFNDE